MDTNKDVMDASQILEELRKLADRERSENEDSSEKDASLLDDAIASIEKFVAAEKGESSESSSIENMEPQENRGIVNTSPLTGPLPSLKNFLVKRQQDNLSQ